MSIGVILTIIQAATFLNSIGPLHLGERAEDVFSTLGRTPLVRSCVVNSCVYTGLYTDRKNALELSFVAKLPPKESQNSPDNMEHENDFFLGYVRVLDLTNGECPRAVRDDSNVTDFQNVSHRLKMTPINSSDHFTSWTWFGKSIFLKPTHLERFDYQLDSSFSLECRDNLYHPKAQNKYPHSGGYVWAGYTFHNDGRFAYMEIYFRYPGPDIYSWWSPMWPR